MSRRIEDLHPKVAALCQQFINKCDKDGIDILITSTYRSIEDQNAIYAQGRTTPGKIVTKAKGGQSYHNYRIAFDFVPIIHGKPQWDDIRLFTRCGEIAESIGLEWAGRWTRFKEYAHCQYSQCLTLAELRAGKQIT